jgi:hypothetical protein
LLLCPLRLRPAILGPPVLGGPGSDPLAVDPHPAVGGLVEAFDMLLVTGVRPF